MILQSQAQFGPSSRPGREASRVRIGMAMLAGVVAFLAVLNLVVGAA